MMATDNSPSVFRLALLPAGQPGVNRLWLFPADRFDGDTLLPPPPFDELLRQFQEADFRFSYWNQDILYRLLSTAKESDACPGFDGFVF